MASGTRIGWENTAGHARASARPEVAPAEAPNTASLQERLAQAVERGAQHLLSLQAQDGYWVGELEADTTLESDYIYYLNVLGRAEPRRIAKLANYVRQRQLEDGGWNIFVGGPSELNATVKAYFALRLAGDAADAPHMLAARDRAQALGGLEATNSYTRFYFALVGALGWEMAPAVPPELLLLPNWFYFNIYEMSSWTRGIVIPLAILYALKPRWTLSVQVSVQELFAKPGSARRRLIGTRNYFRGGIYF